MPPSCCGDGHVTEFAVPGGEEREGDVVRVRQPVGGTVSLLARPLPGPWGAARLRVRVDNRSAPDPVPRTRDEALPTALVAAHMIIGVQGGQFISMHRPAGVGQAGVEACENIGCWPVLAGPGGGRQVMLSSPIILYDHPEIAPESPGELYDGTEIDEILTLRTLALSDAEKQEARATDPRAAALIDRVEALDAADLGRLHGTIRSPRGGPRAGRCRRRRCPGRRAGPTGRGRPPTSRTSPGGIPAPTPPSRPTPTRSPWPASRIARGSMVTLRPGVRRTDAQDMFLTGRPRPGRGGAARRGRHRRTWPCRWPTTRTRTCASPTAASSTSRRTRSSRDEAP